MTNHLLNFFTVIDNQGGIIVRDAPKFDLDLYIQNYRGRTRFDRLFLIGRSSVPLCVDALKAATAEAKRGRDTQRYREVVEHLRIAAPNEPEATFDQAWLESTESANRNETHRLTAELKGYKNNLIKESIRMGNEDLGKHLESIGDLNGAAESYSKMRPDVSTPKQIVDVGKHLVRVSLQRREWSMVSAHLSKMGGNQNSEDEKTLQPYIKIVSGIALMGQERFHEAAIAFLAADAEVAASHYNEVASPNDVAIYGGLLALASMDRRDLQTKVLDNSSFRTFLEREPHIRRAVTQFVNGRYSACIATLESHRPDYLLDIYLQKHIPKIYDEIRNKCIVQYLIPFSRVKLDTMQAAFGGPDKFVEDELFTMIKAGTLKASVNTIDKLVTTVSPNSRLKMQADALETARSYEKQAIDRLRRMSIAAADLEFKGQRRTGGMHGLGASVDMFDETTV
ncbi:26S proteasome subunit RPN7-domain-containing protein [Apodospora peruviana]|uniref:COP9 signalosome complex subunit 1 n=1 Tax=Apodospora peruviana TaxID=516989 RepID=A0AAE0M000_9PEZI|nr:26S proteasome subunit RPN7-domain-containing protein [Apodospora peruviana]